jgi:hypothetical protein
MEQQLNAEQKKKLNKIGTKFFFHSVFNGISHAVMLVLVNFISVLSVQIFDIPEPLALIACIVAAFLVMRRMISINQENYDRFKKESDEIVKQK